MSQKPLIQIGSEVREMNEQEYAQYLIDQEQSRKEKEIRDSIKAARQSALQKLGLTKEEVDALFG